MFVVVPFDVQSGGHFHNDVPGGGICLAFSGTVILPVRSGLMALWQPIFRQLHLFPLLPWKKLGAEQEKQCDESLAKEQAERAGSQ